MACTVYTVVIDDYDLPSRVTANVSCELAFLTNKAVAMPTTPSTQSTQWRPVQIATNGSHFIQSREHKISRPPFFRRSRTIYIDGNVAIRKDPAALFRMCNASLCMFSLGRNLDAEISWLQQKGFANEEQAAHLRQRYGDELHQAAWYGKVILRTYGGRGLSCFEKAWLAAIKKPNAVQRDQVHINEALRICHQSISNLRANMHDSARPYKDPNFVRYFQHTGHARRSKVTSPID